MCFRRRQVTVAGNGRTPSALQRLRPVPEDDDEPAHPRGKAQSGGQCDHAAHGEADEVGRAYACPLAAVGRRLMLACRCLRARGSRSALRDVRHAESRRRIPRPARTRWSP
jgi:hypothetical protein